jgi:RNA polymerase sigma factor (sigma-70 family)
LNSTVLKNNPTKASSFSKNQLQWQSWAGLMERVQQGDQDAYRQLLDEIGPLLFHFVRRRVFNPELVQDIYQEVLLTFHKARHTYEPSRPLGPWLFAVARHSILTALGKNRKFAEREVPMEVIPDIAPEQTDKGLEDELFKALEALPELNRRAVDLLKIRGLTLEEAARELGITVAALKVRAHRGYVYLRKHMMEKRKK